MEKSKKVLLAIENDREITNGNQLRLKRFMREFKGEVNEMTSLFQKSKEEIFKAINESSDIACQTVFVQQSYDMLFEMAKILSRVPESKNIWISYGRDLEEKLRSELDDSEFYAIKHHNIYSISNDYDFEDVDDNVNLLLDFSDIIEREQQRLDEETKKAEDLRILKLELKNRTTGRKVKIKKIVANNSEFANLKEGDIVDEIDASVLDPNPNRGIWVYGITEPVKLLNEDNYREYEVIFNDDIESVMNEILQRSGSLVDSLTYKGISSLVEDLEENSFSVSNTICEDLNIQKRGNRRILADFIDNYRNSKKTELCEK